MKSNHPILWQLFPSFMAIMIFVLIVTAWGVNRIYNHNFQQFMIQTLQGQNRYLQALFPEEEPFADKKRIAEIIDALSRETNTRITIVRGNGEVFLDTAQAASNMPVQLGFPEFRDAIESPDRQGTVRRMDADSGSEMIYRVEALMKGPRPEWFIRVGMPLDRSDTNLNEIFIKIIFMMIIIGIAAAGMSFLVAWQINRPIQYLIRAADRFAGGNLDRWTGHVSSIREFNALSRALQSMADQLNARLKNETRQLNELEAIFGSMMDAVLVVDSDECVLRYNHAAAKLFHSNGTDITGRNILEIIRNTQLHRFIRKTLSRNIPQEEDIVIHNREARYLRATGTSIAETDGRIIGALIVLQDATQIHRLERIRRDFVANVSHELKTPITAVKGFVETLLEGAVEDRDTAVRFLDIILKHTNQLNAVIEDLLSLSRIEQETGNGGIRVTPGRVTDVIKSAVSVCRKRAEAHDVAFRVECDPDLTINMHRTLLQQALVNLIDNALKYGSDHSEVVLFAEETDTRMRIHVQDYGPGIAPEHLDRLFERFYRVDKSRSRDLGGSGLGLAIVKHIIQAHRGTISVRSKINEGTVFIIDLPRREEETERPPRNEF